MFGQCVRVYFQAHCEGGLRADAWPDAAVLLAGNGLVQPQGMAEKSLRTEGIEAKDLPALFDQATRGGVDVAVILGQAALAIDRV